MPEGAELSERLPAVLAVVYLIFNEGYAAHSGEALLRHELCDEALRLGHTLVELMPGEPEALGLLALMELQGSRAAARTDAEGAGSWEATDWTRIVALYEALARIAPSPVIDLNRAVAIGLSEGPAAGLVALDRVDGRALRAYHLLPAARADFLRRLARWTEAAAQYRRAIELVDNPRERAFLAARLTACEGHTALAPGD